MYEVTCYKFSGKVTRRFKEKHFSRMVTWAKLFKEKYGYDNYGYVKVA